MRTISENSAGSTVGKRNRWASTAAIGSPSTRSSSAVSKGTASSNVSIMRTVQEPLRSAERKRFQPCAVGIIKTGVDAVSISKLLPGNQLRNINIIRPSNHHLDDSHRLSRFSNANNSKHRVLKSDKAGQFLELFRRKAERRPHILDTFEWRIVGRSIEPVGATPHEQKSIDQAAAVKR